MTEYSRAAVPAHCQSTTERDMEVAKQPSPWPCVVMLAALLACCLAAPHFWQRGTANAPAHEFGMDFLGDGAYEALPAHANALSGPRMTWCEPQPSVLNSGPISGPWPQPTIEELVAAQNASNPFDTMGRRVDDPLLIGPPFWQPPYPEAPVADEPATPAPCEPDPAVGAAFERIGSVLADFIPANALSLIVTRITDAVPPYFVVATETSPHTPIGYSPHSTLQIVDTDNAPVTLPVKQPAAQWCVPETLYDQLERLNEHPYSAFWASHVRNQLLALTQRDFMEGDDVQSILAGLSEAAVEAYRLADETADDRLRVELLRVHWALARRLDCWAAMHEEHIASRFQGRVAARGELSPYFDSAPAATPTAAQVLQLSKDLELYEKTRDPRLAHVVVAQQRLLAQSPATYDRALADAMEQHYRNANIRVAITAEMVNRMVRSERAETRPVADSIAGAFVRGRSDIYAKSNVELSPATDEWNLRVRTQGVVESNTIANAGPVQLRSSGAIDFAGSKTVIVRPNGVHLQPSDVGAVYRSRLRGVTTDYDWLPFVGGMARERAVQEYQSKQGWVREAMETRVSDETSETLDRDTHDAMERVRERIYARFTERFDEYGLKLTTIEMKSSPERLVARVRVAGDDQLGSHTPRPRALSDSLASIQLHETAMNNMAVTLGLDGQRLTGPELQTKLRDRIPQIAEREPIEVRRDTVFQFAPKDAVQFRIGESKLKMQILFESIELDGEEMPNVTVHVTYVPAVNGLNADLHRDGPLGIEGQLSAGERARLHNIFKTVFPPERALRLAKLDDGDRRLAGLMITQLVLEDGWVGLAIGPESTDRVAERWRSLR